jgi:hypothetical protein
MEHKIKYWNIFNYKHFKIKDNIDDIIISSYNNNDYAVNYLININNPNKIDWNAFSINTNDNAINYLINNAPDKINWFYFSQNSNDNAVNYLINKHKS